ncbi:hypothetical protein [Altererythrobacter sp. GH1-8]|uniref:hypothetical protein n=1 Tax=Altererythrobacter sp. GH1-8 TaxID=3349333 RepID=UPI00374D4908
MHTDASLLAFGLSFLAAHRGGPQLLIGHLSAKLGRSSGLVLIALLTSLATSALAAFAGAWLSSGFIGFERAMIAALALALAAALLAQGKSPQLPREPTRSFGAIALALTAKQAIDPPRLVIFASAAALASPWHALAGGAFATALSLLLGWALAERVSRTANWRWLRFVVAAALLVLGGLIAWTGYISSP